MAETLKPGERTGDELATYLETEMRYQTNEAALNSREICRRLRHHDSLLQVVAAYDSLATYATGVADPNAETITQRLYEIHTLGRVEPTP